MDIFPSALVAQPVVVQDVAPAETFGSVAAALKALSVTADVIFSRVENRVADERARLAVINARIARAKARIQSMAGSSKAIAIFSQPKYPAAEVARLSAYMSILDPPGGRTVPDLNEPLDGALAPMGAEPNAKSKLTPDDEVLTRREKQEAVVELLARVSLRGRGGESSLARAPEPGLGMLPGYLPAVTSVLRFNSRDNPYTEYKSLDDIITEEDEETAAAVLRRQAMTVMDARQRRAAEEEARRLGIAPSSLYEGDNLPAIAAVEYIYRPRMRELAAFELPSNLALPNVADIALQSDDGVLASIAPSVLKAGEPALPTILDIAPPPGVVVAAAPAVAAAAGAAPAPAPAAAAAVPPPPAPAAVAAPLPPQPPAPPSAPLPPPLPAAVAPPPAPAAAAAPPPAAAAAPAIALPAPPDADSSAMEGRGGLLAALANPDNIRKLKKASAAPPADKKSLASASGSSSGGDGDAGDDGGNSKPASSGPMSMMDEMRMKMQLKRRAIAGQGGSGGGAGAKPAGGGDAAAGGAGAGSEGGATAAKPPLAPALPKPPAPPKPAGGAAATAAATAAADEAPSGAAAGGSTGMFRPEAMPGFRAVAAKKAAKKKRADSDDWSSTDEDSD